MIVHRHLLWCNICYKSRLMTRCYDNLGSEGKRHVGFIPVWRFVGREKTRPCQKCLPAYTIVFTRNFRATTLHTISSDIFAGTGYRISSSERVSSPSLLLFDDTA